MKPIDFLNLQRTFQMLDPSKSPDEIAVESYTRLFSKRQGIDWEELLRHRLVVVLAEAGSGKTYEFKYQADSLFNSGVPAFFIPLERLSSQPLEELLTSSELAAYREWRRSQAQMYLFLDAVDEAKFKGPGEFISALDRLYRELGAERVRARLTISSRISEWHPAEDLKALLARFAYDAPRRKKSIITNSDTLENPSHIIVVMEPLNEDQVASLAGTSTVSDWLSLKAELDQSHAWDFARRPVDVRSIVRLWNDKRRLGSLTDLIEHELDQGLREGTQRGASDALPIEKARSGAESLAAANTLCQDLSFNVLDDSFIGQKGGINPLTCLPTSWNQNEVRTLLTRPLFDAACYGKIRFHHRRLTDYLASSWLAARMKAGCELSDLEPILIATIDGKSVVRPHMEPVIAWLAGYRNEWAIKVREWILESSPDIHFRFGDPASLPGEYKRKLLTRLADLYRGRTYVSLQLDMESLSRFGSPELEDQIAGLIGDPSTPRDLRSDLIILALRSRLSKPLIPALKIACDDSEDEGLRRVAIALIRDVGDASTKQALAINVEQTSSMSSLFCGDLCQALYPFPLDEIQLINLIRKSDSVPDFSVDLPFYLERHLTEVATPESSLVLIKELLILGRSAPHIRFSGATPEISSDYAWVGEVIPSLLMKVLRQEHLIKANADLLVDALQFLDELQVYATRNHSLPEGLIDQILKHETVRKAYFDLLMHRREADCQSTQLMYLGQLYCHSLIHPILEDIDWLLQESRSHSLENHRELTSRFALQLALQSKQRLRGTLYYIRRSLWASVEPWRLAWALINMPWHSVQSFWFREIKHGFLTRRWRARIHRLHERVTRWLHHHKFVRSLKAGKNLGGLSSLAMRAYDEDSAGSKVIDWASLRPEFGAGIADAARQGCVKFWRTFSPPLPHEQVDARQIRPESIIGLAGIQTEVQEGTLDLHMLSSHEATLLVRYGLYSWNAFPSWFHEVSSLYREIATQVIGECIRFEWRQACPDGIPNSLLNRLVWHGASTTSLVVDEIKGLLTNGDPACTALLPNSISLIFKESSTPFQPLNALAPSRVLASEHASASFYTWLSVWLQIDAYRALECLEKLLNADVTPSALLIELSSHLSGHRKIGAPRISDPDFLTPRNLRVLIPLIYQYVDPSSDINRGRGAYSPTARDDAQHFRSSLLTHLAGFRSEEASKVLEELASLPLFTDHRDWIAHLLDRNRSQRALATAWTGEQIREFEQKMQLAPTTHEELFRITGLVLQEIKDTTERGERSRRADIHMEAEETRLRDWFQDELQRRARGRYFVTREEEVQDSKRTDIRIIHQACVPVPIELKWAENWSFNAHQERITNQLVGQYLRDVNAKRGIYLLGYIGKKNQQNWRDSSHTSYSFQELIEALQNYADGLVSGCTDLEDLKIIGVDFRRPCL